MRSATHRLDAVVALTGHPAWLTDHVLGDHHGWGTSGPAAVSGYPSITVPAGRVSGLPVGLSFIGPGLERAAADRPGSRLRRFEQAGCSSLYGASRAII